MNKCKGNLCPLSCPSYKIKIYIHILSFKSKKSGLRLLRESMESSTGAVRVIRGYSENPRPGTWHQAMVPFFPLPTLALPAYVSDGVRQQRRQARSRPARTGPHAATAAASDTKVDLRKPAQWTDLSNATTSRAQNRSHARTPPRHDHRRRVLRAQAYLA